MYPLYNKNLIFILVTGGTMAYLMLSGNHNNRTNGTNQTTSTWKTPFNFTGTHILQTGIKQVN